MAGTTENGRIAAETNKRKYGEDFYVVIGAIGGRKGHTGGFFDRELARRAGAIGGRKSSRKGVPNSRSS